MTNLQNIQENVKKEIIKRVNTDSTKKLIAKNFINEYMYIDRNAATKVADAYEKYKKVLQQFGCKSVIELSGFTQIFRSAGYKIDKINSIFYSPSILGLGFKSTEYLEPIKIFDQVRLSNLKKYGITFVDDIKGNKLQLILNADAYLNGIRNGKDFEQFNLESVKEEETSDNTNKDDIGNFITQETVDIQDTPIITENTTKEKMEENKSIEIPNNDSTDDSEIQMYKNLVKAELKHAIAEQEYQFELYEFKIYKLKSLEKQFESGNIDKETLEKTIKDINNMGK